MPSSRLCRHCTQVVHRYRQKTCTYTIKIRGVGPGEMMAQQFIAFDFFFCIWYSYRGLGFDSQHPRDGSESSINPVLRTPNTFFWPLRVPCVHVVHYIHAGENIHTLKRKSSEKKKNRYWKKNAILKLLFSYFCKLMVLDLLWGLTTMAGNKEPLIILYFINEKDLMW